MGHRRAHTNKTRRLEAQHAVSGGIFVAELTDDMIERRFQRATSNPVIVNIPGLSGLGFAPLTAKERGVSARAYSSKLIELHK